MTPDQLQAAREALRLSVPGLSRELGVHERTIYGWLSGAHAIPSIAERFIAHLLRYHRPPD